MARILVINPNSTQAVTDGMDRALEPLRFSGGPEIACVTLADGPPGIETQAHVNAVVAPICRQVAERDDADAFVIACFSDPGLHAARETTTKPVYGIAEAAMAVSLTRGERFGILSILDGSIPRHARAVRAAGLSERFAGDVAIGIGVTGLVEGAEGPGESEVMDRLVAAGTRLRDHHRADVLILGCAGMASYRTPLSKSLGVAVIDPTLAAVTLALGL